MFCDSLIVSQLVKYLFGPDFNSCIAVFTEIGEEGNVKQVNAMFTLIYD
jgi:hypothetical protein